MKRHARWMLIGFAAGWLCATVGLAMAGAQSASAEVVAAMSSASRQYGVSERFLYCLAWRESRYQPRVTSPAGDGGLFQFKSGTFAEHAWRFGFAGASPYQAWAAAHVAAGVIATQPLWRTNQMWPPSRSCGSPWA